MIFAKYEYGERHLLPCLGRLSAAPRSYERAAAHEAVGPACPSGPAPPHPSPPAHWLPPARCSPRPLPPRDPSARTRALPPQPWCTCCPTCPRGTPDAPDEVKPPPRNVPGAASLPSAARFSFSLQLVIPPELLLTRPPGVHPRAFARALPPAWHDPLPPGTPRREQDSALRLLQSSFKCRLPGEGSSAALPAQGPRPRLLGSRWG